MENMHLRVEPQHMKMLSSIWKAKGKQFFIAQTGRHPPKNAVGKIIGGKQFTTTATADDGWWDVAYIWSSSSSQWCWGQDSMQTKSFSRLEKGSLWSFPGSACVYCHVEAAEGWIVAVDTQLENKTVDIWGQNMPFWMVIVSLHSFQFVWKHFSSSLQTVCFS